MRIQHNIAAMNSYRQYANNTSAVAKNLEKLSSGYKINRAGDDAAGLAISEKMRAQITGLQTAQKNAKDGISLVKTAEGALQEVHDMLNRMVTLATQSANGTYDNETDRAQLQKEVEQLKTEINRIADSSNFNGIQLLDGSMDADGRRVDIKTTFSGLTMGNNINGYNPDPVNGATTGVGNANTKGGLILTGGYSKATTVVVTAPAAGTTGVGADGSVDKSDASVRYHQDAKASSKTTFTVDLDGLNYTASSGTRFEDLTFALQGGTALNGQGSGNHLSLKEDSDEALRYDVVAENGEVTSEAIAKAIEKAITDNGGKVYIKTDTKASAGAATTDTMIEYTVTRDGDKLHFEMTDDGYTKAAKAYNDNEKAATKNEAANYFQGNFNFSVAYGAKTATSQTLNADGVSYTQDEADLLNAIGNAFDDKIVGNLSTCHAVEGSIPAGTIYAQACIRFNHGDNSNIPGGTVSTFNSAADFFADGHGVQLGNDYYVFARSDEVYNSDYQDNVKVVDIRDLKNLSAAKEEANSYDQAYYNDLRTALDRLSVAAKDNEMFDVQVEESGAMLVVSERTTYTGDANLTEKNWGLESQIQKFDSATSATTVLKEAGKSLSLQIGDTSADYNQMKVNIKDIHVDSLGIADMDISTQEGASAAIDKIKNAINYVSDVRGTLGATQNRLEHTINNLSVMTENIQDAESTIRDTDIAEEMMAYTKNNILVQSAQAMLAQANQIPQGVLQLLG